MPIGVRGGVVHVQTRAAVTDLMDDLTWREARYFGQRFPRPDMLHEPPLPALHVMAAPTVCYMAHVSENVTFSPNNNGIVHQGRAR